MHGQRIGQQSGQQDGQRSEAPSPDRQEVEMTIKLRNKTYSLRIRVPARYRHLSRSSHVWRSLGTDSLEQARAREHDVRARLMAQWEPA